MFRRYLVFCSILILLVGALGALGALAQEELPGIPRDLFYHDQMSRDPLLQNQGIIDYTAHAASSLPANVSNKLRLGGTALVFDCYDDQNVNMHGFDSELPLIAATGAGHVRLTCSIGTFEQGTSGTLNESRYQELRSFINLARSNGLLTIVDFHIFRTREPGSSDWSDDYQWHVGSTSLENRAISVISETARRLSQDVPLDWFTIQPANEPISQGSAWYSYQVRLFNAIRGACAGCSIAVMADDWQGDEATVYNLDISPFSAPFYADVHWYSPINLSHCQYPGTANNCPGKQYPGTFSDWRGTIFYDRSWFVNHLSLLENWSEQKQVFVNIGEFGTTASLASDVRARYLGDLASVFRQYGWGYTEYEWHRNFGVKQYPEVVAALFSGQAVTPVPVNTSTPVPVNTSTPIPGSTLTPVPEGTLDTETLSQLIAAIRMSRDNVSSAQATLTGLDSTRAALMPTMTAIVQQQASYQQLLNAAIQNVQIAEQAFIQYIRDVFGIDLSN